LYYDPCNIQRNLIFFLLDNRITNSDFDNFMSQFPNCSKISFDFGQILDHVHRNFFLKILVHLKIYIKKLLAWIPNRHGTKLNIQYLVAKMKRVCGWIVLKIQSYTIFDQFLFNYSNLQFLQDCSKFCEIQLALQIDFMNHDQEPVEIKFIGRVNIWWSKLSKRLLNCLETNTLRVINMC